MCLGAQSCTRVPRMEVEANVPPLWLRRDILASKSGILMARRNNTPACRLIKECSQLLDGGVKPLAWVPWSKVDLEEDERIINTGIIGDLLNILAELMDFDYELVRPSDGHWGTLLPNGSWSGMIGMVQREEVEFGLGPFTMTPERQAVCEFSESVHSDNQALMMVRPGLESDIAGFLKPFTTEVWLLILLCTVSISCAMTIIVWAESKVFHTLTSNIITKVFDWVLQTVTQESSHWLPQKDGGCIIVITWLLASLVFMSSYSGILTAMLTLPRVIIPIDSLADLVEQTKLPWRLEAGTMTLKYLTDSQDPVRQKVMQGMSGFFVSCWDSRAAIANGEFAGICDEISIMKAMSWDFSTHGECHLYLAKKKVYTNAMMALAFKKNSSYLSKVNKIIGRMKGAGIIDKWLRTELANTTECLRTPGSHRQAGVSPLTFQSFAGTLLVHLGGVFRFFHGYDAWNVNFCMRTFDSTCNGEV
ncbi:glutamate receptor-like [Panulirus ornatus]|uniref:glutamate receptor-like n=1 Tax=Panulirus ornatus TaxID=150431 RepID=UPI003A899661